MHIEEFLDRLDGVKQVGSNRWLALCPHGEKTPSLNISVKSDGKILLKCFGCSDNKAILDAMGLTFSDLFPEPLDSITRDKYRKEKLYEELQACELRLAMAKDMRRQKLKLTEADKETERQAFLRKRQIEAQL